MWASTGTGVWRKEVSGVATYVLMSDVFSVFARLVWYSN